MYQSTLTYQSTLMPLIMETNKCSVYYNLEVKSSFNGTILLEALGNSYLLLFLLSLDAFEFALQLCVSSILFLRLNKLNDIRQ